jgi:hypothetical protein
MPSNALSLCVKNDLKGPDALCYHVLYTTHKYVLQCQLQTDLI